MQDIRDQGVARRPLTLFHLVGMLVGIFALGMLAAWLLVAGKTHLTAETPVLRAGSDFHVRLTEGRSARAEITRAAMPPEAIEAIPAHLTPLEDETLSVAARGGPLEMVFTLPDSAASYDLMRWDGDRWQFAPSTRLAEYGQLTAPLSNDPVALFEVGRIPAQVSTNLSDTSTLDAQTATALNQVLIEGFTLDGDGTITSPESSTEVEGLAVISGSPADLLRGRETARVEALVEATQRYEGLVLDVGPLADSQSGDFVDLLRALRDELPAEQVLGVRLPTPTEGEAGWHTVGYDWAAVGAAVDLVYVTAPAAPSDYAAGGTVERMLGWAVSRIDRAKLHLVTTALSVDVWGEQVIPVTYDYALAPLGDAGVLPESRIVAANPQPGDPIGFALSGQALDLRVDPQNSLLTYRVFAGDGEHHIWLNTGAAMRQRLDWLDQFEIGGIMVEDMLHTGASPAIRTVVREFKAGEPSPLRTEFALEWTVSEVGGEVVTTQTTDLGETFVWVPEAEGEYLVGVDILAETVTLERSPQALLVSGATVGVVPEFEAVVTGSPDLAEQAEQPELLDLNLPAPVVQPRVVGNFELGGQVNHVMYHPDRMREAGMEWVKFQVQWEAGMSADVVTPLIAQADAEGMKVLLSITGQVKYPSEIDYEAYIDFLERVAYYGPDAIEIWNEGNLAYEWPRGEIDGVTYVKEMLAPGYNAIKSINPNIMVIAGALAPTGAFFQDGGCSVNGDGCDDWIYLQQMARAGAANYMDCMGVHFNAGATSPYARDGHPADPGYQHYSWYFGSMVELYGGTFGRPLCFTELGYLSGDGYGAVPGRFNWASDISVSEQAQWLAEAAVFSQELGSVRMLIVWNVDFVHWGDDPMAGYAIVRPDGSCPACAALGNVMK